jgi:hypothetical protein
LRPAFALAFFMRDILASARKEKIRGPKTPRLRDARNTDRFESISTVFGVGFIYTFFFAGMAKQSNYLIHKENSNPARFMHRA